jgi:hypothetical protein
MNSRLSILFFLAVTLGMGGCEKSSPASVPAATEQPPAINNSDHQLEETVWDLHYTHMCNEASMSAYACISEIYAIGNGNGPACKLTCEKYKAVQREEIENPVLFAKLKAPPTTTIDVCPKPRKSHKKDSQ